MADLKTRLKEIRQQKGLTLKQIADGIGVSEPTVQRYESGEITNLKYDKIVALADFLNCEPAYLMGWSDNITPRENAMPQNAIPVDVNALIAIPILGAVRAGVGGLAMEEVIGHERVDPSWVSNHPENFFFLEVRGDSMLPKFEEKDLVLIKKQTSVDSGAIAVVLIDGEEGVLKKVVYGPGWTELHSINPYYPVRRFEGDELERLRVIGCATAKITRF